MENKLENKGKKWLKLNIKLDLIQDPDKILDAVADIGYKRADINGNRLQAEEKLN